MDDFDRAQALELAEYERNQRAALLPEPLAESAKNCAECDDPIPQARRLAVPGITLCVACQQRLEHIRKRKQRR